MVGNYTFKTTRSINALHNIQKLIANAAVKGITQKEIAARLHMSPSTVSQYLRYLVEEREAHTTEKVWQGGGSAAIYKPGPDPNEQAVEPRNRRRVYSDLPLEFFGVKHANK